VTYGSFFKSQLSSLPAVSMATPRFASAVPNRLAPIPLFSPLTPSTLCVSLTSIHRLVLFIPVRGEVGGGLIDPSLNGQFGVKDTKPTTSKREREIDR
jgi:hypothetical protein